MIHWTTLTRHARRASIRHALPTARSVGGWLANGGRAWSHVVKHFAVTGRRARPTLGLTAAQSALTEPRLPPAIELLSKQYAALNRMLSVTHAATPVEIERMLVDATIACRQGLEADRVSVWLKNGDQLELQAASDATASLRPAGPVMPIASSRSLLDALKGGEVVAVADISDSVMLQEHFRANPGLKNTKSRIDTPILIDGELAGILIVSMASRHVQWTLPQIQFTREMAALITLGLERRQRLLLEAQWKSTNQHLVDELERRQREKKRAVSRQRILADLIRAADDDKRDIECVAAEIGEVLRVDLEIDRVAIWRRHAKGGYEPIVVTDCALPFQVPLSIMTCPCFSDYCSAMLRGEPLLASDVTKAMHLVQTLAGLPAAREAKSRLDVPILRDGLLDGMVICTSRTDHREWSQEDVMFAAAVSNVVSILLERRQRVVFERQLIGVNTRLVDAADRQDQTEQAHKRRQALLADLIRITGNETPGSPDALHVIADQVRQDFGIDRVAIWIYADDAAKRCIGAVAADIDPNVQPIDDATLASYFPSYQAALRLGQPLLAPDVDTAPHLAETLVGLPTARLARSRLDVPIMRDGRFTGMIIFTSRSRRVDWTSEDAMFGAAIASIVSILLEQRERQRAERELRCAHDQLAEEVRRKEITDKLMKRQQSALTELIQTSSEARNDIDHILQTLTERVRETLDVDRVALWLGSGDKFTCGLVALSENGKCEALFPPGQPFPFPTLPIFWRALESGAPLTADDISTAPHLAEILAVFPRARTAKSRIDIPVMRDGKLLGFLSGVDVTKARSWTLDETLFCSAVSGVVSVLLERRERLRFAAELVAVNEQLRGEVDRREKSQAVIKANQEHLTQLVRNVGDPSRPVESTYQVLVDHVRSALRADVVAVWLGCEDDPTCTIAAVSAPFDTTGFGVGAALPTPKAPQYFAALAAGEPVRMQSNDRAEYLDEVKVAFPLLQREKSRIDMPIIHMGKVVGTVVASTIYEERFWSQEDMLFCSAIASVTSVLVERQNRQRVEEELRRANVEVLAANKAKSLFLANMSHEIRTPMNGVFGMTDLLLRTELTERQTRLVQTVNQSARTLLTIINDILDLSRIEAGKLELDPQDFDLHRALEGVVELLVDDAQKKNLDLSLYIAPHVPRTMLGDAARLRQICVNLVGNAVKFTRTGAVAVRVTTCASNPVRPRLLIEVRDTGIGISPEMLTRLFQPFAQGDSSVTRRFGGTGLGLSISMHLAQLMGGIVSVNSELGKGASVTVDIPLGPQRTDKETDAKAVDLVGRRALVVDDRESNREIVVSYLEAAGMQCDAAASADEAECLLSAALAASQPYACMIADMIMPGTDGLALVQSLRASPRNAALGIVMVTSLSWKGDQRSVRALGVNALMTKPIRRDDLISSVRQAIQQCSGSATPRAGMHSHASAHLPLLCGRVLVAEDNPVNIEVAREHLLQLGLECDIAQNGAEAVHLVKTGDYQIVLMDCQMPDVDGFEATRRIRAFEALAGRSRLPVVAVTANAYAADRVACLEAGMDDYLAKPFSEDSFVACLARWLKPAASADGPQFGVLDSARVAELRAVQATLYDRIGAAYLAHSPKLIADLTEAAAAGNVAALQMIAHSLKSSSANVGASRLAALCSALEQAAAQHRSDGAVSAVRDIMTEFKAVGRSIEEEVERAF